MDALARMQRGEPVDQGLVNLRPADAVGAHPDGGEDATRRLSSGLAAWDEGGAQHAGELFGSAAVDRVPRTQAFGEASHGARPHRRVRITRWLQYTNGTSAQSANTSTDLNAAFAYDNEGRVTSQTWPSFGPVESQTAGRR